MGNKRSDVGRTRKAGTLVKAVARGYELDQYHLESTKHVHSDVIRVRSSEDTGWIRVLRQCSAEPRVQSTRRKTLAIGLGANCWFGAIRLWWSLVKEEWGVRGPSSLCTRFNLKNRSERYTGRSIGGFLGNAFAWPLGNVTHVPLWESLMLTH